MGCCKATNRNVAVLIFIFIFLCLLIPPAANANTDSAPYAGKKLTEQELEKVLRNHKEWLKKNKNWHLVVANFVIKSPLWANLKGADLRGADLREADLSKANLSGANLTGATMGIANLAGAQLIEAKLIKADMFMAILNESVVVGAEMREANFEPAPGPNMLPQILFMAFAKNLSSLKFTISPHALMKLRNEFRETGFREQEREITYAIEHSKRLNDLEKGWKGWIESKFNLMFFELPVAYGMSPGRALIILVFLIPFFSVPHIIALLYNSKDGIWKEWADGRMRKDLGSSASERMNVSLSKAIVYGIYFSILSAFHIGWRDLNVGNWIARIQPREYTLKATGWVRTVSGIQSLISVYLLALWALSYFGRPFG